MNYYVYIVRCSDNSYYTGITNDIDRRYYEHTTGLNLTCYTYKRRPLQLIFCETFENPQLAIDFEKRLKGWSRKKKEALIEGNWDRLQELAVCKNKSHFSNVLFDSAQGDQ